MIKLSKPGLDTRHPSMSWPASFKTKRRQSSRNPLWRSKLVKKHAHSCSPCSAWSEELIFLRAYTRNRYKYHMSPLATLKAYEGLSKYISSTLGRPVGRSGED